MSLFQPNRVSSSSSRGIFILLSFFTILRSTSSNPTGNLTACILAPPGQQNQVNQQLQANNPSVSKTIQQRTEQVPLQSDQPLIGDVPITTTILPPSVFRSPGDSRNIFNQQPVGRRDGSTPNNFWNQPRNQTRSNPQRPGLSRGYDSNTATGFEDQQRQVPLQFDPSEIRQQRPQQPIYDRSGFRREPLHPAYGNDRDPLVRGPQTNQRTPSLLPNDATFRSSQQTPGPWSTFSTTASPEFSRRDGVVTTNSPFDAAPVTTSFFDPTRKPKTAQGEQTTTRRPFSDQSDRGLARPTSTPGLTREFTTPKTSPRKPSLGRGNQPFDTSRSGREQRFPGTENIDPHLQTVPEYAYIKQPISKVLDQPDLELEGKPVKFGIMKDAMDRVGLLDLAEGPGPVTMFCPTDDAFLSLNDEVLTKLQQNPNYLRNTMLRHIVNFDVPPESLKNNIVVPSYSGEPLIINVVQGGKLMMVRGTPIIAATNAQNGVIYVINKVMTDETTSGSLLEELAAQPDVSTFYNYLSRSPVARKLQGQGPFTVLAPNNSVFEQLSPVSRQVLEYNPTALDKLLSFHILEGAHYARELETLDVIPATESRPEPIKLRASPDGSISVGGVGTITKSDVSTGNGVIHVMDGIIFPSDLLQTFRKLEVRSGFFSRGNSTATNTFNNNPNLQPTVGQALGSQPQFGFSRRDNRGQPLVVVDTRSGNLAIPTRSREQDVELDRRMEKEAPRAGEEEQESTVRFYRWLQKSGFMDVLNNTGNNYTVVLPVDRAVNRLPAKYQKALEENPKQLENLLMYHIIPGVVNLTRVRDDEGIPTVSGRDIRVKIYPSHKKDGTNTTSLSGAQMIGDAKTSNGKVRFLITDRVMYPPQGNLYDVISRSPILKSLTNLIKVANLEAGLSDTGPFTLFAPSDEAFMKLPAESLEYLAHDPQSSRAFLLRHIVQPVIFTSSIPLDNSTVLESTTGERLELIRNKDVVKVDGVGIKYADITATNGVIHVLDHVL